MSNRGPNGQRPATALHLLVTLLGPPLVWLTTLQLVYGVATFACKIGVARLPMRATAVVTLAVIAATFLVAWRDLRASVRVATSGTSGVLSSFVAGGGLVLVAQFLLVIVAQELAIVLVGPCLAP